MFGPVLGPDYSTSILLVQRLMDGAMPGCPQLSFGAVDVRDVADLHIRAMTHPAAKGGRFLAVAGDFISIRDIARILKNRMGASAKRVPTRQLPNWLVRLAALRDPAVKQILPERGAVARDRAGAVLRRGGGTSARSSCAGRRARARCKWLTEPEPVPVFAHASEPDPALRAVWGVR
ncbi:MAG: hypothetical protein ACYCZD_05465 [Rhodanobacter sp.]